MSKNYLDRDEIYIELCFWKNIIYAYDDKSIRPPNVIGEAIRLTTEGLSRHQKFYGYSWKEDMIGSGIESMIKGLFNFNEQEFSNPHGYMSMSAENAFLQTMEKEERQLLATYKTFLTYYREGYEDEGYLADKVNEQFIQDMENKVTELEAKIERKKERRKLLKLKRDSIKSPLTDMIYGEDYIEKIDDEIRKTETFYKNKKVNYGTRGKLLIRVQDIKKELGIELGSICIADVIDYMKSDKRKMDIIEEDDNFKLGKSYVDITFMEIDGVEFVDISWGE